MTTIKQALKEMIGIRVMCGHRWLIWNGNGYYADSGEGDGYGSGEGDG